MNETMTPKEDIEQNLLDEAKKALSAQQFAAEILRLREEADLTQKELAALIKVDKAVISRVENANHGVSLDLVMDLSIALKQDPHRLANIYWGMSDDIYNDQSRFTLERIKEILDKYYSPANQIHHPPFTINPIPVTPEMKVREGAADQQADEEARAEAEAEAQSQSQENNHSTTTAAVNTPEDTE